MSRALGFGAAALALAALLAFVFVRGASLFSSNETTPAGPKEKTESATAPVEKPPTFGDWPKPAAVLVLTGEQHGYLEPCGCSEKQSGGMARRSDLFEQLRGKGWAVTGLDLGGTVQRARKQTEFKFAAIADALRMLDYRGLGLGPEELALQPAFLLSEHTPAEEGSAGLAFLGTNEVFFGTPDLDGGPKKVATFELGGVKVGAAMVLGESRQRGLFPEGVAAEVTFTPPGEAITDALKLFKEAGTTISVLLSYADLDESRALVKKFPKAFDLVVSAGGPEDPAGKPEKIDETWLVTVGHKGKYAGVLGLYPDDVKTPFRYELVDLNKDRFDHDKAMDPILRDYQQALRDNLSDVFADLPEDIPPGEGSYVGAKECAECHKVNFDKWVTTGHAKAYKTLTTGRPEWPTEWVDRKYDPDCLSCHVTGWNPQEVFPYAGGFLPEEIAAEKNEPHRFEMLQGQQCENCHGPGGKHVETFERWKKDPKSVPQAEYAAASKLMFIDRKVAKENLCVRCHDYENSPKFDFEKYWSDVAHPGRQIN